MASISILGKEDDAKKKKKWKRLRGGCWETSCLTKCLRIGLWAVTSSAASCRVPGQFLGTFANIFSKREMMFVLLWLCVFDIILITAVYLKKKVFKFIKDFTDAKSYFTGKQNLTKFVLMMFLSQRGYGRWYKAAIHIWSIYCSIACAPRDWDAQNL